ncbi:MAG: hypothetical protein WD426_05080 [Anditalea sp.]
MDNPPIMKNLLIYLLLIPAFLILISCGTEKKEKTNEIPVKKPDAENEKITPITFDNYEVMSYPDAIIEMYSPLGNENFKEGKIPFEFNIKNYPFGEGLRNFQLRLIINGDNPISYNMPIFQREFKTGTYRAVAYLIDEEGIALKEFGNYVDRDFTVGDSRPFPDSDEPHMVLNLPEDGHTYQTGEEVIIDFLLLGGALKEDQLKFILSIDGQDREIKELVPVKVENLPTGNYDLELKLIKGNGEELSGLFTSARRTIKVE